MSAILKLFSVLGGIGSPVPDRRRPPPLGPPPSVHLPDIQTHALSNGLPVLLVELHKVPVVAIHLVLRTGASADPLDRAGLASLTADMLNEGAGARDALELAEAIDHLGADLTTGAGWDDTTLRLHTPVARLEPALAIFADVALRPTFPAEELARLKKRHLTELLQARQRPRTLAAAAYQRALFGPTHRFGTDVDGLGESIARITREDILAHRELHYLPGNAVLVVVGDVRAAEILPMLERYFGAWPRGEAAAVSLPDVPQVAQREVVLVDHPGAAQSELRLARVGAARSTPDYHALEVMNTILGGSFTSRLNRNLREEHGYTYGAGSVFSLRRASGPFVAACAVETEVTDKAVVEMLRELEGIHAPVPREELERAKNYLILGHPSLFQTTRQIAFQISELALYDLPLDFFDTYVARIREVSAAEVERVARAYVDAERILVVVVGDAARIESGLTALELGPLRRMAVDEALGPAPAVSQTRRGRAS